MEKIYRIPVAEMRCFVEMTAYSLDNFLINLIPSLFPINCVYKLLLKKQKDQNYIYVNC